MFKKILINIADFLFGNTKRVRNTFFVILGILIAFNHEKIINYLFGLVSRLLDAIFILLVNQVLPVAFVCLLIFGIYKWTTGETKKPPPPKKKGS